MSFLQILIRSLRRHRFSGGLALISAALGVALIVAVVSFREQSRRQFETEGLGVDAVLAPKGSPLQVVLNSLYHLDEMPGTVPWTEYERVRRDELVAEAFPFVTGHSYSGFRVNAVEPRFFARFEYRPGRVFSFAPEEGGKGRPLNGPGEAVAGWAAARALGLTLDQTFHPVHGVRAGDPPHAEDAVRIVGIMAPTGTPHDRALYIPLASFYTLGGHGERVARMADHPEEREISGAYLRLRRIRGGALHPGIRQLKYELDRRPGVQLVVPTEVLPQLLAIIGWADRVLFLLGTLVVGLGGAFLFVVLVATLREQRRDLALLRMLGAGRRTVFGLILAQALLLSLGSALLGLVAGHALVAWGSQAVARETGLRLSEGFLSTADVWTVPAMLLLGAAAGILPAVHAYRMDVLEGLRS